jgi:uncharacterized damage-inducible protein DinB
MPLNEALLAEFDQEIATTRLLLERIPEKDAGWKPHPRSASLGDLAVHLAAIPWWLEVTLTTRELDLNPPGGGGPPAPQPFTTVAALLASLDANAAAGRAALAGTADADFARPWSLKGGGRTYFTLPRAAVLRSFVLSHLIHHRAQLGVYLRLRDVPLPPCYGPTADTGT